MTIEIWPLRANLFEFPSNEWDMTWFLTIQWQPSLQFPYNHFELTAFYYGEVEIVIQII